MSETSSERDSLTSSSEVERNPQLTVECCARGCKVRRVGSKGAVLVLVWGVAGYVAFGTFPSDSPVSSLRPFEGFHYLVEAVDLLIPVFCIPLAGVLGDAYFGKHRLLRGSVFTMWIASIVTTAILLVEYEYSSTSTALNSSVLLLADIAFRVGEAGFQVLLIMFGVDQLPDASTEEVSAFLHWVIWTWFLGLFVGNTGRIVYNCQESAVSAVVVLMSVLMTSLILCSDYLCKRWLVIEPPCANPMKNIGRVLRYAFTHKYPVRRSALTYWEDKIPSRMDLGKIKYGGPFTNEQVEDVKTFFRVIVVTVCILAFVIPRKAVRNAIDHTTYHYRHSGFSDSCYNVFGLYVLMLGVLYIPIYEFVVYPLARNWIPSSLKRVVILALLTATVSIYLMVLEVVGTSQADSDVPCMFRADNASASSLPISYFAAEFPTGALHAVQWLGFNIAAFEFICAQSPYNMKGLLTGLAFVVILLAQFLGNIVYDVWSHAWKEKDSAISCGTWYYAFTSLIGLAGLILLVVVARWYKRRERDDIIDEQRFVEIYYAKVNENQPLN